MNHSSKMVGSSVAKEKNRSLDIYTLIINLEMFVSFAAEGKIKEPNYLEKEEKQKQNSSILFKRSKDRTVGLKNRFDFRNRY